MAQIAYSTPRTLPWPVPSSGALGLTWAQARVMMLLLTATLALGLRANALSTYGLSEDEVQKVRAIEQYRAGRFNANAEHPMLMKLAMWGSEGVARSWNLVAPPDQTISTETAIRLPNVLAGAATTIVLFALAELLFGTTVALVASLLWALDINAIAFNRIGKEDSFLLLFFLLAVWCYERAKRRGLSDPSGAQRWYAGSGALFGLMLASKYMPHYLGLYALFNAITDPNPGANRPDRRRYYGAMLLAFIAANPVIVMPETWRYGAMYLQGHMLTHHGYLYAGQLYVTNIPVSPLGVPVTYYFRVIATKVPLVVLAAVVPGLIEMVRRRGERGFVLLRVVLLFVLIPYSLMAAKFLRYTLPLLAIIDLIAAVGFVSGIGWLLRKRWLSPMTRVTVSLAVFVVSVTALLLAQWSAAPFYSLFRNGLGERLAAPGVIFAEETYDYGVREAVAAIAEAAGPSASIVSDAPAVVAHYLKDSSRPDLRVRSLSGQGIPYGEPESWVIVQDEHSSFENQQVVEHLRRHQTPWQEFRAAGALAAQIFRIRGR
jgi:hypothetical protein